jgi:hypothetical protein
MRQKSLSLAGLGPAISGTERPLTYILDRAATGIGQSITANHILSLVMRVTTGLAFEQSDEEPLALYYIALRLDAFWEFKSHGE